MPTFDTTTRAELDVIADERREDWIAHQEALALAEGVGAEQPEGLDLDPIAGLPLDATPLSPEELDRAVARDERRACGERP